MASIAEMVVTESELRQYFAELEDEELLKAARGRAELTPLAQDLLVSEVFSRHLLMPPAEQLEDSPVEQPETRIVTIRRFATLIEGVAARGALEAAGIPCFLRDENTVRTLWHLSGLVGGVRLDVTDADRERAEHALVALDAQEAEIPFEPDAEAIVNDEYLCSQCGSWDVNRIAGRTFTETVKTWLGHDPVGDDTRWTCNNCNHVWIDNTRE